MNRGVLVCNLCAVLSSTWLANVDAHLRSEQDSGSIVKSIETLSKAVEALQTEIQMQSSMLNDFVSKEELEIILLNNLATKSDMQMQKAAFENMAATATMHDISLSNLQASVDELKTLLIKSNVKDGEQLTSFNKLEAQSTVQTVLLNDAGVKENQYSLVSNFLTKEEMQVSNLTNKEAKATTVADGVKTLTEGIENVTVSKGIVEGIIAGTTNGVVIIPLNSREQRTIGSKPTLGLAFNWQSRKVYWIEYEVGLKIADLDGSNAELLISNPKLRGLAVDQITGNLYYGVREYNPRIRVCDSMGKKCVTIASGVNFQDKLLWDIALHPSEGLMFCSSVSVTERVTRANMDRTNATVISLEDIRGLFLDEFTGKLYWANQEAKSIGNMDLNGHNLNTLLNTTIYPALLTLQLMETHCTLVVTD